MNPSAPGGGFRPVKPTLCRYFSNNGYCFYGDQCQFMHAKPANENRQGNASSFHRSNSTPVFQASNGPVGPQGHRGFKGGNPMNQAPNSNPDNMIHNFSGLSFSAKPQVPQGGPMTTGPMHNSHTSPLSPSKKSFGSSLAPGGPVSPLHSPKPMSVNANKPKTQPGQVTAAPFEFLPNTTNHPTSQQQQPFNPESIDGTTYFYPQQNPNQPSLILPSYHAVVSEPAHLAHLQNNQTRNNAFSMSAQLRQELMNQHALSMAQLDPDDPSVPKEVDNYHSLCPLEPLDTPADQGQRTFGYMTTCYKAVNSKDGLLYVLRRVHGFRLVNAKSMVLVDQWKKITHSNIVSLREVFTTKAFGDSSLVFVYDYHAGAETLLSRHFSGPDSTLPVNPDGSLAFPRGGMQGTGGRSRHGGLMPEKLIWSYIIQLSSALRAVHAAGLACRMIDPSKILLIGNSRLRINGCGIFDILSFDPSNSPSAMTPHFQQEDLTSLGKLVLALASCYSLQSIQREHIQQSLEYVAMNYSSDLKNLIIYLLGSPPPTLMKSVNDIMPMIGARFYTQLEAAQVKCDVLEGELAKEMENGRLLRILSKLGIINERPELGMDHEWSETGDRYLLKLFRDYLFHSVTDDLVPVIDLSHIVTCLNKLDAGSPEKVCLTSRDEQSVLVVSYRDLRSCFEGAFNEVLSNSLS